MGDYGFRICSVCGKDVLWEEAFFMREDIVCCSGGCYDVYCAGEIKTGLAEEAAGDPQG